MRPNYNTLVMVVPAARVVLLYRQRRFVCVEKAVDAVKLAPRQRVTEHLATFLDTEFACL